MFSVLSIFSSNLHSQNQFVEDKQAREMFDIAVNAGYIKSSDEPFKENEHTSTANISLIEESVCVIGLSIVMGGPIAWLMLSWYIILFQFSYTNIALYTIATIFLMYHPLPDLAVWLRQSFFVRSLYKYFSYRFIFSGDLPDKVLKAKPFLGAGVCFVLNAFSFKTTYHKFSSPTVLHPLCI